MTAYEELLEFGGERIFDFLNNMNLCMTKRSSSLDFFEILTYNIYGYF